MHNFESNYEKIMEVLDKLDVKSSFLSQVRVPKLSDRELVCINLTSEYTGIDSERQLFRHLPPYLSSRIERSVYNRRKRKLFPFIERIRQRISEEFNRFEDVYVVDSMPLEVCKLSRSSRSKVCREQVHSSPNKGYCASQGTNYYGYKLHAVCSASGVFKSLDISPASVHDVNYLKDIRHQLADCTLLGDGGVPLQRRPGREPHPCHTRRREDQDHQCPLSGGQTGIALGHVGTGSGQPQ